MDCIAYEVKFSFDLGKASPVINELTEELNTGLARFGCNEKLKITAPFPAMTIKSSRELTEQEQETVKKIILESISETLNSWDIRIESFRRKSGNVQQSVV